MNNYTLTITKENKTPYVYNVKGCTKFTLSEAMQYAAHILDVARTSQELCETTVSNGLVSLKGIHAMRRSSRRDRHSTNRGIK